jgi:hypothetical protein
MKGGCSSTLVSHIKTWASLFSFVNREWDFFGPFDPKSGMEVQRGAGYLQILGKLNPGINIERAEAEMRTIASSLEQQYQESNALIKTCLFITCDRWRAAFPTF